MDLEIVQPDAGDRFGEGAVRKLALVGSLITSGIPATAFAAELHSGRFNMRFLDNPGVANVLELDLELPKAR
ncbi:MAG TPA: hypothetical protein VJW75_00655 [Candidatus Eisenbacteria bacterium]|nr:hypothetical protein [Candidatus Eisenbacteria bacterium]